MQAADVLRQPLDRWKTGIDTAQPDRVAAVFTEDAVFQGLRPYTVGRQGVHDYYASQPAGMTVDYRILESRFVAVDLVLGYLKADFSFPDRAMVSVHVGVLARRAQDGWRLIYYQASAG